jgi:hypothetical protein
MNIRDVCTETNAGGMRNMNVELEFRPATGFVTITLPYLPVFKLRSPEMVNFQCEMPSHLGVGGINRGGGGELGLQSHAVCRGSDLSTY